MKKTRITQKKLINFLNKIADVRPSTIDGDEENMVYYSKIDGSFITRVGMEKDLKFLLKKGVTEELQSAHEGKNTLSLGFNPEENKWYGWSHRAIFGFGIGSECKPGHCHYKAKDRHDYIQQSVDFWKDDEYKVNLKGTEVINEDGVVCVEVSWIYNEKVRNEKMKGTRASHLDYYPDEFGKGEWTAKTMEDAKEMAIDFANGVS